MLFNHQMESRRRRGKISDEDRQLAYGISGSIAAARSPTWSAAIRRARCVARKLLSENPRGLPRRRGRRASAGCSALRPERPIPAGRIGAVKMGTTVATNALLERKGERTLLLITRGFRDALRIGYQARPHIFAKQIVKPEMLYERVVEVDERVRADGTVERPPDCGGRRRARGAALADGIRSVAIVFMHA